MECPTRFAEREKARSALLSHVLPETADKRDFFFALNEQFGANLSERPLKSLRFPTLFKGRWSKWHGLVIKETPSNAIVPRNEERATGSATDRLRPAGTARDARSARERKHHRLLRRQFPRPGRVQRRRRRSHAGVAHRPAARIVCVWPPQHRQGG